MMMMKMKESVYWSNVTALLCVVILVKLTSGQVQDFVGCYSGVAQSNIVYSNNFTPGNCISYCFHMNYEFAGLSYKLRSYIACTCTNSLTTANPVSDEYCRLTCPVNRTQLCGGYGVDRVYYIIPPPTRVPRTTASALTTLTQTTSIQVSETTDIPTTLQDETATSEISETKEITRYYDKTAETKSSVLPTSEAMYMTAVSSDQKGQKIWYICGAILVVFIATILIVVLGIRNNGRKNSKHSTALPSDQPEIAIQAKENIYHVPDSPGKPKSPLLTDISLYQEPDYAEVPETHYAEVSEIIAGREQLPDILYYTVHRPESTISDDEVHYGHIGRDLAADDTIYEENELPPNASANIANGQQSQERPSQSNAVKSVNNVLYETTTSTTNISNGQLPANFRPSQSSIGSVDNVIYAITDTKQLPTWYSPSNSSSVGSVDNTIYECGSPPCCHGDVEVFSPSPSVTSFEGTVANVIYETSEMDN